MSAATTADAVVVGAGVIGAAVALELARGGRRTVVVDRRSAPGEGSTGASSAIVRFNYSTFAGVALAWESLHCWQFWGEHVGAAAGEQLATFHRTGLVMLDVDVAPKQPTLALFDRAGVPYEVWDADALEERVPGIDTGSYAPARRLDDDGFWAPAHGRLGGFLTPDAGYVDDPQLAAVNLMRAAERAGAAFVRGRRVVAVPTTGAAVTGEAVAAAQVTGVRLDDGTLLSAPVVVNVAGPWSRQLNALAGADTDFTIGVRALRQEVAHVPAPPGYTGPAIADLDLGVYLRPTPGGGLLIGGTEPECDELVWLDDPDRVDPRPTVAGLTAMVTRASRRLPQLRVPPRPAGIVGVYDVADDWTPIYDRTAIGGYYVAMGTSGNQFKNAPVVGQMMAALIDAVESGLDHDRQPLAFTGRHTGLTIDLGTFSRRRPVNRASTGGVLG